MTPSEIKTLSVAVLAPRDVDVSAARDARNDTELARLMNQPSTFVVWKSSVSQDEIMQDGLDWACVDKLTVGKARIWEWLFDNEGSAINPSKANVRAGIDEAWKGTAADLAVRAAVYVHCKRFATAAESLLATGAGTDEAPGLLTFEGSVGINNIGAMLNK